MGRCSDCGFLAARNNLTMGLDEVYAEIREQWGSPAIPDPSQSGQSFTRAGPLYGKYPVCFVQVISFQKELRIVRRDAKDSKPDTLRAEITDCIRAENKCPKFTPWIQGSTPKEHSEMLYNERIVEMERQRYDAEREHREKQRKDDANRFRTEMIFVILSFIVITGSSLWAAYIQASATREAARLQQLAIPHSVEPVP
jgi:hypothetical protein